jgi:hypothetical protein
MIYDCYLDVSKTRAVSALGKKTSSTKRDEAETHIT